MEVILLEKMRNLGELGETVKVKPGYGRNFLIPSGKAVMATKDNTAKFEERRAELERAAAEALDAAQARADKFAEIGSVTIAHQAGDEGKLFGSVGPAEIAQAVTDAGAELDKREVRMPEGPLRQTGEYEFELALHSDVVQTIKVVVVAE